MANLRGRPWRNWYNDAGHRKRRAVQLQRQPTCEDCAALGRATAATIADHAEPHGGDINKFRLGKLRSLCADCHNRKWAADKRGFSTAVGLDGWPIDAAHPANKRNNLRFGPK
jgi:5-methylcytosine-specific restriction protein A